MPPTEAGPLGALLAGIVDYAGLFPPADLEFPAAVAAYDRHRAGAHAWMLGSFVVPLARVEELAKVVASLTQEREAPRPIWPLSVLVPGAGQGERVLEEVGRRWGDRLSVRAIEVAPLDLEMLRQESGGQPQGVEVFYEVPLDDSVGSRLDAIAALGANAKVRTGGLKAEAFPSAASLVRLVRGCADRQMALKATAGLHHAFRGRYRLTYDPHSAETEMHGFLELALVAELVRSGKIDDLGAAALLGGCGGGLVIDGDAVLWCGHRFVSKQLADLRRRLFRSFGSCSFQEPVDELARHGLL